YYEFNNALIKQYNKNEIVLKCYLKQLGDYRSDVSEMHYFVKPKDLQLKEAKVYITEDICEHVQCFTVTSDVLMKDVFISIEGEDIHLSDNYFDMLPEQGKTIYLPWPKYRPFHMKIRHLEKKIKIKSLVDTY
ncbi:MAG TPA: glycoside hydrolase family 2 protein, partial [Bacteroidia bacterium]|nr:glycoside hydrolase family 2 protein [Bacteroidia bacterium]